MSSSDDLSEFVRSAVRMQGIEIDPGWGPDIALHLKLDAAQSVEQSEMTSQDLTPRFDHEPAIAR